VFYLGRIAQGRWTFRKIAAVTAAIQNETTLQLFQRAEAIFRVTISQIPPSTTVNGQK
jgi:hypothetical protein